MTPAITSWRRLNPHLDLSVDAADPWVMPMVLRAERGVDITHEEALDAAARAVAVLLADERSAPEEQWHRALESWMQGRIRKVARRARASKWDAVVNTVPGIVITSGNAEVFVAPPHPMSTTPEAIARLQVSGLDLPCTEAGSRPAQPNTLHIAVNPSLGMSTGKAMAQVGHAAQLAMLRLEESEVSAWSDDFATIVVTDANSFDTAPNNCVIVEDAGFTEIPAGSLTCKAWIS